MIFYKTGLRIFAVSIAYKNQAVHHLVSDI